MKYEYKNQHYTISTLAENPLTYYYLINMFGGRISLLDNGPFISPESAAESAKAMIDFLLDELD